MLCHRFTIWLVFFLKPPTLSFNSTTLKNAFPVLIFCILHCTKCRLYPMNIVTEYHNTTFRIQGHLVNLKPHQECLDGQICMGQWLTGAACGMYTFTLCCSWGVGCTVPVEGGVVPPTVSVNAYFRLSMCFLSIHHYAIHCISIHASS